MARRALAGDHPPRRRLRNDVEPVGRLADDLIIRIYAKHDVDPQRYEEVLTEMRERRDKGRDDARPVIKVVRWKEEYYAVEGSHRLKAAHELGIIPDLRIYTPWCRVGVEDEVWWDGVAITLPAYSWAIEWKWENGRFVPNAPSTPKSRPRARSRHVTHGLGASGRGAR